MFFFKYPEWINFDFGNWTIKEDAPAMPAGAPGMGGMM